jgi:hypothetical protein
MTAPSSPTQKLKNSTWVIFTISDANSFVKEKHYTAFENCLNFALAMKTTVKLVFDRLLHNTEHPKHL